jgi:twitching motility protein PilT
VGERVVIRLLDKSARLYALDELGMPPAVLAAFRRLIHADHGIILVTGPTGSGKSTTLAAMIDLINRTHSSHIITLEDPIEYIHSHKSCLVTQREMENDTLNFAHALRASLRQAPDVILLGEMRDFETIQTALTAAETGHLLFSTLHTLGASKTIDRIVDVFPASQQQQVRIQLSMVLQAVVSQQLIPAADGGIVPAFEVMLVNSAIANMIRENKVQQMDNVIYAGSSEGMISMDNDILRLYKEKRITRENALLYAINTDVLLRRM